MGRHEDEGRMAKPEELQATSRLANDVDVVFQSALSGETLFEFKAHLPLVVQAGHSVRDLESYVVVEKEHHVPLVGLHIQFDRIGQDGKVRLQVLSLPKVAIKNARKTVQHFCGDRRWYKEFR